MISAAVLRGMAVAGIPVAEPCLTCRKRTEPTLETMIAWLVQQRIRRVGVEVGSDGAWRAEAAWPGPDPALEATGQSAADAVAKIVLEVASREPS